MTAAGAAGLFLGLPHRVGSAAAQRVRSVLPNGLVVLVEHRPSAETVALQLVARAGTRDDRDLPGATVLTSRVMFDGTSRRPSETDIQREIALAGGTLARGTTLEWSFYSCVVPSYEADLAFDLLSDIVVNPLFQPASVARHRQFARLDLAQRRANANALLDDLFRGALFAGHPLSIPVFTAEGLEGSTRESLIANRARLWGASNLVLAVVGRIETEDALAAAARFFEAVPAGAPNVRTPSRPAGLERAQTVREAAGQQQAQFRLGFLAPGQAEPADRYPLGVLDALTSGSTGRLFRELRSERGLAYSAGSAYFVYQDAGTWFATAGVDPQNVDTAVAVVRSEIARLQERPPGPDELAAKVAQLAGQQILADETNAARAGRLALEEALGSDPMEVVLQRSAEVTPADVQRVAQTYLRPERSLLAVVAP